ncbi:hypothetical protein JCM5353_000760 [Sporobolomyces roseus]
MSLKQELQTWSDALVAFDQNNYPKALSLFQSLEPGSKIYFNIGLIYATRGEHQRAIDSFEKAIELDPYLAVAYFQAGVSQFLLGRHEIARRDFDDAWLYLRSNEIIDYEQIGLKFQLYSCEVLFNRGLCLVYMGRLEDGLRDWTMAMKEKYTQEHDVIDEAYLDNGAGYTVFSVSVGTVFRPSEAKLANLAQRDFLGKTTVIAAANPFDLNVEFQQTSKAPSTVSADSSRSNSTEPSEVVRSLSRSQTTAARLEKSVDGMARPLRRRPTQEERKVLENNLKRSQTAPVATSAPSAAISTKPIRAINVPRLPAPQDPRPPSPPDSLEETITFGVKTQQTNQATKSRSTSATRPPPLTLKDSASTSNNLQLASFSEKRSRRNGLTIRVPPPPSSSARSPRSGSRSAHLEPRPRPASFHSHSPSKLSAISPGLRTPHHLRSTSLSSPRSLAPAATLQATTLHRCRQQKAVTRPKNPPPVESNPVSTSPPTQSLVPRPKLTPARQDSSSSTYSKKSSRICLSPVSEETPKSNGSAKMESASSIMLAYLQADEKVTKRLKGVDEGDTLPIVVEKKVRIRLRYRGTVRVMVVSSTVGLAALVERIQLKLNDSNSLLLRYADSDGCLISIIDDEDWQNALDMSQDVLPRSSDLKLEIVVGDTD